MSSPKSFQIWFFHWEVCEQNKKKSSNNCVQFVTLILFTCLTTLSRLLIINWEIKIIILFLASLFNSSIFSRIKISSLYFSFMSRVLFYFTSRLIVRNFLIMFANTSFNSSSYLIACCDKIYIILDFETINIMSCYKHIIPRSIDVQQQRDGKFDFSNKTFKLN